MKGLILFLVIATLGVAFAGKVRELPVCPPYDPEGLVVIFPNPDDCSTFFICDDKDRPILKKCQAGLWFNPEYSVCDYPENIEEGVCIPPASV